MALSLFGSPPRPSERTMRPISVTSFYLNCILSAFNLILFRWQRLRTFLKFPPWSLRASSSVFLDLKTGMSCAISFCPGSPSSATSIRLWNSSGDNPNGIRNQGFLPQGVINVVARLLGSSNWICQKPFLVSNTANTCPFDSREITPSIVGRE